ncbi:MAG TPA: flagellar hook basal-body protein, partial [Verrucomicrobiae bacterium]|nr:flagellar hook basal-body protein [Verrucomicrobiae bacterium]
MIGSLQTGVSGLQQFQQDLQVIGNNIANVNTVGYKSASMDFEDSLSQNLASGPVMQVGTGVATASINSNFTQGTLNTTGVPTDLAVSGDGFFLVKDASSGLTYATRDGEFHLDANGYLVNANGNRVQGLMGSSATVTDLQINSASAVAALNDTTTPAPTLQSYSINSTGQITATLSDGTSGVIGQFVLQDFTNPQALMKQGNNLYSFTADSGPLASPGMPDTGGLGQIVSGAVETSNVDLAGQMADLITAQRAFEANAKIITTSDE